MASAQGSPPPDALVERFIAALPDLNSPARLSAPSAGEIARLEALNPGRSADIRPILEAFQACTAAEGRKSALVLLRMVARELGEARLQRLVEFYEGPDFPVFARLGDRVTSGERLPPAEQAEFDRLLAAYPFDDFRDTMTSVAQSHVTDSPMMDGLARCSRARSEAFERSKLRAE